VAVAGQLFKPAAAQQSASRSCTIQVVVDYLLWQQLLQEAQQLYQLPQEAARVAR